MKIKVILSTLVIFLSSLTPTGMAGAGLVDSPALPDQVEAKVFDPQAKVLADYLKRYDSPLQYSAQDFIDAAREYDLDWRLVAAISGVESTFGKAIPGGYNAWGWGVYGNQAIYFKSWKEGIFVISEGLKKGYVDKGFNNPYSMNRIYAASPYWGYKVSYFMQELGKFADHYQKENTTQIGKAPNIAAASGQIASN